MIHAGLAEVQAELPYNSLRKHTLRFVPNYPNNVPVVRPRGDSTIDSTIVFVEKSFITTGTF